MKMKRTLSFLLALLMMASLISGCAADKTIQMEEHSVPLDDLPDSHEEPAGEAGAAEPAEESAAGQEQAVEPEVTEEPAPAEEPEPEPVAEQPSVEPEVTAEPEPDPTEEPAAEIPAEPEATEEPAAEPAAVSEPAPAAEIPAEPEATEEPEPTEEPEEKEIGTISGAPAAISLPEASAAAQPVVTYVKMDCNGGSIEGITSFQANVLDGKLAEGFEGFNDRIRRDGYAFQGWYRAESLKNGEPVEGAVPVRTGDEIKEGEILYAGWKKLPRTVTLDAGPGNFWAGKQEDNNYTRTVELVNGDELPAALPDNPVYNIDAQEQTVDFVGWYSQKSVVEEASGEDGKYTVISVKPSGQKYGAGDKIPENITTLYAGYQTSEGAEAKKVTFYLDWNGINGMWGHCLTLTRSYKDGKAVFTTEDAAVYELNYAAKDAPGTWTALKQYWLNNTKAKFGYTFYGWALTEKAQKNEVIEQDTPITNGMSFYAVWEKDDGTNSWSFERVDPEAGPLESIRIDGRLTQSAHPGSSLKVELAAFPVRTDLQKANVKWFITATNSKGKQDTIEVASVNPPSLQAYGIFASVSSDKRTLTVRYEDNGRNSDCSVTVSVQASKEDGTIVKNSADATLSFFHNWVETGKQDPTCKDKGYIQYQCSADGCGAERKKDVPALEHVYSTVAESGVKVVQKPTCTTPGEKQRICLRCKEEEKDKDGNDVTFPIPALGHTWSTTTEHVNCHQDKIVKACSVCGAKEEKTVAATNPSLHKWVTEKTVSNCLQTIVDQRCSECGKTQTLTQKSSTPNAHDWRTTSTPVNCSYVKLIHVCAVCNTSREETVRQSNAGGAHVWGEWQTTKDATTTEAGQQTRKCSICGTAETKEIPMLPATPAPAATATPVPAAPNAPAGPSMSGPEIFVESAPVQSQSAAAPEAVTAPEAAAPKTPASEPSMGGPEIFVESAPVQPEPTAAPEAPAVPEATVVPEATAAPEATAVPEAAPVQNSAPAAEEKAPASNAISTTSSASTAKKLATPKNLKAKASGTGVKISWSKVSGAEKYQVYYKTGSGSWKRLAQTSGTSYTWKNAKPGTKYSFTVRCVSKDGKSFTSGYNAKGVSFTTKKLSTPKVTKVAKSGSGIKITWRNVTGAEKYRVLYKTGNGSWKKLVDTKKTSYTWKGPKAGVKYTFTVQCITSNGKTVTSSYGTGKSITFKK